MRLSKAFFFLTAAATTIFTITILAMVTMPLGDPGAPVNGWFNRYGAVVMTAEVLAIGILGMTAMITDHAETSREKQAKARTIAPLEQEKSV
ncbi:hypothetical protein [Schlesneria paludicola]|uniref:hypothetical protein n=1 Tax=Schlesneria paludicola TaxID=360056 RepID=UPI00029A774E|nr:hypothetical protein [Schlesneria paludicola]